MEIQPDAWLSRVLGQNAFRVILSASEAPVSYREALARHLRNQRQGFYDVRLDPGSLRDIRELSSLGFYGVDVGVTLERTPDAGEAGSPVPGVSVAPVEPAQHGSVLDIAATCFRHSRFHADPLIPEETAHRIKREWVNSCLTGDRGSGLLVGMLDSEPAGFLATLDETEDGRKIQIVDLLGVRRNFQGRGVGRALVSHLIRTSRSQSVRIRVGTQLTNLPSLRLYARLGFLITQSRYVMHMHVRNGTVCFDLPCK